MKDLAAVSADPTPAEVYAALRRVHECVDLRCTALEAGTNARFSKIDRKLAAAATARGRLQSTITAMTSALVTRDKFGREVIEALGEKIDKVAADVARQSAALGVHDGEPPPHHHPIATWSQWRFIGTVGGVAGVCIGIVQILHALWPSLITATAALWRLVVK